MRLFRSLFALLAVAAVFAMVAGDADARPRGSFGSRGTRTFSQPAPTATAPNAASPINRSMTQPGAATSTAARPPVQQPGGLFGGGFGRGLAGGLLGGLLGAGLFGMLFGHGFLGGLAGFASFIGLLLQVGLIVLVGTMLYRWWQRRSQPQPAYAGMPDGMSSQRSALGGLGGFGGGGAAPATAPLEIQREDFDTFERLLGEVQTAYGREDLSGLRSRVTPEMLSYYAEELSENASRGVVNQLSDVKLLQGDLAEAWREGDKEYASVAMRYSLKDQYVDRNTGKAADGTEGPQEATEVWTFSRAHGGNWLLSAIQQTQ
ncbi:MAG TPA: TIM44-like domain-containing protein [Xanthobacteraceae bacterium]|nr:TIM44-like domain-containing protein [Xanthobacteraceae bacterium]